MWVKTEAGHSLNMDHLLSMRVLAGDKPNESVILARTRDQENETLMRGTQEECEYVYDMVLGAMNATSGAVFRDIGAILQQRRAREK